MSGRERSRPVSGVSRRVRLSIMIAAFLPQHDFRIIVEIRVLHSRPIVRTLANACATSHVRNVPTHPPRGMPGVGAFSVAINHPRTG